MYALHFNLNQMVHYIKSKTNLSSPSKTLPLFHPSGPDVEATQDVFLDSSHLGWISSLPPFSHALEFIPNAVLLIPSCSYTIYCLPWTFWRSRVPYAFRFMTLCAGTHSVKQDENKVLRRWCLEII